VRELTTNDGARSFLRKQYSDKPPSDEEILGLLGTHVESFISLSAHVNRAYLNALFRQEVHHVAPPFSSEP
jgi:hypothetical protein